MMLDTDNLRLVPFTPQQLLALIERPEQFLELAGVSADAGMHVLFTSGEISPAWLVTARTPRTSVRNSSSPGSVDSTSPHSRWQMPLRKSALPLRAMRVSFQVTSASIFCMM